MNNHLENSLTDFVEEICEEKIDDAVRSFVTVNDVEKMIEESPTPSLSSEDVTDFDKAVKEILAGEEIPVENLTGLDDKLADTFEYLWTIKTQQLHDIAYSEAEEAFEYLVKYDTTQEQLFNIVWAVFWRKFCKPFDNFYKKCIWDYTKPQGGWF